MLKVRPVESIASYILTLPQEAYHLSILTFIYLVCWWKSLYGNWLIDDDLGIAQFSDKFRPEGKDNLGNPITELKVDYYNQETGKDKDGKQSQLQYLGVVFAGKRIFLRHKGYAKFERRMTRSIKGESKRANELGVSIAKRKIYEKFTPLGKMNYVTYAQKAAKKLGSDVIRQSIIESKLFKKVRKKIMQNQQK